VGRGRAVLRCTLCTVVCQNTVVHVWVCCLLVQVLCCHQACQAHPFCKCTHGLHAIDFACGFCAGAVLPPTQAQELLRAQKLREAADAMAAATAGTAAATAVAGWVEDARARAELATALAALQARATVAALAVS
jgi:hypothetical protein